MYKVESNQQFKMPLQVLPYSKRYQRLKEKTEKKKIIYIKNEFDNSTFRYRCYNFEQALKNSQKYAISYFLCQEIPNILPNLSEISLIVFQRTTWTIEVENLIHLAKINKIPIIYDMDDLLYKIDYVPFFMNHVGIEFKKENTALYLSIAAGYEMVSKKCDAYLTTTPFLKLKLEEDYHKKAYVISNFLNQEQQKESKTVLETRKEDKENFVIGYFSGSPSHKSDFRIVENALIALLEKYQNIYVKIVGFMNLEGKLKEFQKKGRIIFKELVPYQQLQYEIGSVDVNIIPLVETDFNEGKSELKFFEAGILKIPSCMSPTAVYKEIIKDGENGIIVQREEWFQKLEELYKNLEYRKKIGSSAYQTALTCYLPETKTKQIEDVYDALIQNK